MQTRKQNGKIWKKRMNICSVVFVQCLLAWHLSIYNYSESPNCLCLTFIASCIFHVIAHAQWRKGIQCVLLHNKELTWNIYTAERSNWKEIFGFLELFTEEKKIHWVHCVDICWVKLLDNSFQKDRKVCVMCPLEKFAQIGLVSAVMEALDTIMIL